MMFVAGNWVRLLLLALALVNAKRMSLEPTTLAESPFALMALTTTEK